MSDAAKRAQVEQAVRRLLAEGPGAMMGSRFCRWTPPSWATAPWWTRCSPSAIAGTLKGPFLMLSETPTNNAVNFVTGAGGFLQQVIFGYTGLRFGEGGSSRRSTRCCLPA